MGATGFYLLMPQRYVNIKQKQKDSEIDSEIKSIPCV